MPGLVLSRTASEWNSSNPEVLAISTDTSIFVGEDGASKRLVAMAGAQSSQVEYSPSESFDLSEYHELRFWVWSNRLADGSSKHPFYLEFSYVDSGDSLNEEHRWFLPINRSNFWEERHIGIENERRSSVTSFRFRCLTDMPFTCNLDDLRAVSEAMLLDLEQALLQQINPQGIFPQLTNIPISRAVTSGATQLVLPLTANLSAGNQILVQGGSAGDEIHDVVEVSQNDEEDTTTLNLAPESPIRGTLTLNATTVSLLVPSLVETSARPSNPPAPSVILTLLDVREDLERTGYVPQRDSFRRRNSLTVCSVRPPPRAYLVEYQLVVNAPLRTQQLTIYSWLLQRLSMDRGLRILGRIAPIWMLPPLEADDRELGILTTLRVRIGTYLQIGSRQERSWTQQVSTNTAPIDQPLDQEGIVLNFQDLTNS